jgi:hypothetical protein
MNGAKGGTCPPGGPHGIGAQYPIGTWPGGGGKGIGACPPGGSPHDICGHPSGTWPGS